MMDYCEYLGRIEQATDVIIQTSNLFSKTIKTSERATRLLANGLATMAVNGWLAKPRGKPPWHKGRWKTRGGRDQDRWRKAFAAAKIMRERRSLRYRDFEDYCRANGIEFRRFVPFDCCDTSGAWPVARVTVDGVDECGVAIQMADELQCDCDSFSGMLTLSDNPDCDFVKGGESDVMPR